MMEPCISISNLTKIFPSSDSAGQDLVSMYLDKPLSRGKTAVDDVTLSISKGMRLGIVGRNGAGKSTFLHLLAGLSSPTSGTIAVTGKITSVLTLGVGLREDLSGRENIYIDGEIQARTREMVDGVIDQIIDFADLGEFIDYPVRTYSTGMKARLAFSMISHIDPEILIIDEALSVGDAAFSTKATQRIKEICARGKIVIIVSHSMQAVKEICNRCLWMDAGKIVMDGTPELVTQKYIESVRSADEATLLEKFRELIGERSLLPGWQLARVELYNGSVSEPRGLLESGQYTRVSVRAVIPSGAASAVIRLTITRLDGLLVFDEGFPTENYRLEDCSIGLEVEMNPLVLGAAIYRLDLTLSSEGFLCAESSSIFEIYTLNPPTGGKPMLLYPLRASATQL